MTYIGLSKSKELHVIGASDGNGVTHTLGVDALHVRTVDGASVTTLRVIGLCAFGLVVVIAKHTSLITLLVFGWSVLAT